MNLKQGALAFSLVISALICNAQNSVGIGVATPNKNAVLELVSTGNNQGLMIPKLTTAQRTAPSFTSTLTTKENGLMVFDGDDSKFYYWESTAWKALGTGNTLQTGSGINITGTTISAIPQDLELTGSILKITNNPAATPISLAAFTGTNTDDQALTYDPLTGLLSISRLTGGNQSVSVTPSGTAGGDLAGSYPNPTLGIGAITSAKIQDGTISNADISGTANITAGKIAGGALNQVLTTTAGGPAWSALPPTVTSITAGTGLSGGTITTTGTVALANTAVTAGVYGSATAVPAITIDAQGRITNAVSTAISGAPPTGTAGGDLTGTYPNPQLGANVVTNAEIADGTVQTADILDGTILDADISATAGVTVSKLAPAGTNNFLLTTAGGVAQWAAPPASVTSLTAGTGLSGGIITNTGTIALANTAVTAGVYGSATAVPAITIDAQGRITNAVSTTISGAPPTGTAGGDLTGTYPNPQLGANVVTNAEIADGTIQTADILDGTIVTADISDGTILDADISATAAVAVSKLAPGTNSQVLTTSGSTVAWASPGGSPLINNAGTLNLFAGSTVGGATGGGNNNAFYGEFAGAGANGADFNVLMGTQAGQNVGDGTLNAIIGWQAGQGVAQAGLYNGNTFIGARAGRVATSGPNTFIGERAGSATTTGTQNVYVGNGAGDTNTTGAQNTLIGYNSDTSTAGITNSVAIGFNAIVDLSNKVRIGNGAIAVIEGQVAFTAASDRRLKNNIENVKNGLDLIMGLRPVSYQLKNSSDQRLNWGFIAQEVETLVGKNNAVVTTGGDKDKMMGLRYTDFIAPLVRAVQEQQQQIASLNKKVSDLETAVRNFETEKAKITAMIAELERVQKSAGIKADTRK